MRFIICVLAFLLVATASMHLMGDAILYACNTRGQFKNNGTTYVCHKSPALTGDNKE